MTPTEVHQQEGHTPWVTQQEGHTPWVTQQEVTLGSTPAGGYPGQYTSRRSRAVVYSEEEQGRGVQ